MYPETDDNGYGTALPLLYPERECFCTGGYGMVLYNPPHIDQTAENILI